MFAPRVRHPFLHHLREDLGERVLPTAHERYVGTEGADATNSKRVPRYTVPGVILHAGIWF